MIRRIPVPVFLLLALLVIAPLRLAQAQDITVDDDFKLAWSLDPRAFPDLFPRGPAFGARSVLAGMDLDGDGNKEFLFTTDETLAPQGPDPGFLDVYLYEAAGDDTYEHVWHYSHPDGSNSLPALAYGDIDGDGLWEIYLGIPTIGDNQDLLIFEQDETGAFPAAPTITYGYERIADDDFRPAGFQIADVDGDGQQELLTVSRTGGRRELVVIAPDAGLDAFATFTIEFEAGEDVLGGGGVYDVDVADFDNDGRNEIWVNTWDQFSLAVFEATGPDTYALQAEINNYIEADDPGSFNSHDFLFHDIDGDERLELIYPLTDGKLYFLDDLDDVSTLTGEAFAVVGTFDETARARGGHIGDLDGDGLLDIVASHGTSEKVSRIEYNGTGNPADSTSYTWSILVNSEGGSVERYYPMRITDDLDGDGYNEVVLTNLYASDEGQALIMIVEYTGMATPIEPIDETPQAFALRQNYPNPFNPTTTIEYTLPTAEPVTLRIYNVMGQLVRTLVHGETQPAGLYRVEWDSRNDAGALVGSGTYLYTLETPSGRQTRVMTLLK